MIPGSGKAFRPHGDPLSVLDCFFLYLESQRTPMHSGSIALFEGGPLLDRSGRLRLREIRAHVEQRLHLVPKLRRRVAFGMLGEVVPQWVDDPDFDISNHVRHIGLPSPGTELQLAETCAELFSVPIARDHPLWEMWFIEGLEGGRVALLEKLHHSLADGLAAVELATVLLDAERHPLPAPAAPPWHPRPTPSDTTVMLRQLARAMSLPSHVLRTSGAAFSHPLRSLRDCARSADAICTVLTPRTIAPRSSLNASVGQARRLALLRRPLDELEGVERRFGVTLNDIVLSAVASGVGDLYRARGELSPASSVQVLVPVGGHEREDSALGNRVSAMIARLPVGSMGPVTRLRAVARETARCKRHHQFLVGDLLLRLAAPLPQPALALLTQLVHHQPFVNIVVTNVPGPHFPLYALGARMLDAFPLVPLGGNLTAGVAVLSYDAELAIGLSAERDLCPDLDVLSGGIERGFSALVSAAHQRRQVRAGPGVGTADRGRASSAAHAHQAAHQHAPRPAHQAALLEDGRRRASGGDIS